MKVLIFDTETTGLPPKRKHVLSSELALWPHIVQLSYIIYDTDTQTVVKVVDNIVKMRPGVTIPESSIAIHKITQDISETKGSNIDELINEFIKDLSRVTRIVGHNIQFDIHMIQVEMLRIGDDLLHEKNESFYRDAMIMLRSKIRYCTMWEGTPICQLKRERVDGTTYLKPPKLMELYAKLFGNVPAGLHNSMVDVLVCFRCYHKMVWGIDPLNLTEEIRFVFVSNKIV